jgi:predicted dehydrogenase
MTGSDRIRVALIGYGLGGEVFHAPLVSAVPELSLETIVTSDPGRQRRARARYPSARIVDEPRAIWEASDRHDLVVISTHNVSHVALGLDALAAGLATVIDKPLAATAADGRRLAAAAAAAGLLLSVFQNRRWDADFRTVRHLLEAGRLGTVHRFESRYERWVPTVDRSAWRERGAAEEAGGLLYDLGSHLVDQAMHLFGKPTHVYAEVDRRRPDAEVDDDVFVALEHPGGVRSHLWTTVLATSAGPRFRVLGDGGTFEKFGMDVQEPALAGGGMPGDRAWGREPEAQWGRLTTPAGTEVVESLPGAYETYYEGIAHAMRTGGPPPVDVEDAIEGLEVLEASRESARTRDVVAL